ncbi:hypothetical protein BD410DRAFT_102285 [Rickenella mellea]|uniref:Uncharacterized protein n=1 Tax=Rickenella mellea TaxID=50990 RepID=A0A4Y7PM31_9AGAM|nr:hypothetical protein BD410DRAFT_102285 [Rickenella mellea]
MRDERCDRAALVDHPHAHFDNGAGTSVKTDTHVHARRKIHSVTEAAAGGGAGAAHPLRLRPTTAQPNHHPPHTPPPTSPCPPHHPLQPNRERREAVRSPLVHGHQGARMRSDQTPTKIALAQIPRDGGEFAVAGRYVEGDGCCGRAVEG